MSTFRGHTKTGTLWAPVLVSPLIFSVASAGFSRLSGQNLSRARSVILVLLIGLAIIALARLVWLLFSPLSAPAQLPDIPRTGQIVTRQTVDNEPVRNPFSPAAVEFEVPVATTENLQETSLDLKLHGVRVDGERSSAIIDVNTGDNSRRGQGVFGLGEELIDGVELVEIRAGEAIISRAGVREVLRLEGASDESLIDQNPSRSALGSQTLQQTASAQPARPVPPSASDGRRRSLQDIVQPRRRALPNGERALFLFPGRDREAFTQAGLQARDRLLKINNLQPPTDIRQLYQLLEDASISGSVEIVVERGGTPQTIRVPLDQLPDGNANQLRDSEINANADKDALRDEVKP